MRRTRLIAVSAVAGLAGVAGAVVLVAALSFRGLAPRTELTEAEHSLLVQVDDLIPFGVVPRQGRFAETCRAKRNVDGSLELEYTYDVLNGDSRFTLKSEAEVCATAADAAASFRARASAYRLGTRFAGGRGKRWLDQPDLPGVGAANSVGQVQVDGKPAGSVVVVLQDRTVFSVLLSGVFIDDPADWAALFAPHLAQAGCVTVP